MLHRERSDIKPPFFKKIKENGKDMWLSEITNASREKEPRCVKGGILADDMGLGKTLQTIGLILINPPSSYRFPLSSQDISSCTSNSMKTTPQNNSFVTEEAEEVQPVDMGMIKKQKVETLKYIISKVDTKSTMSTSSKKRKKDLVQACFTLVEDGILTSQEFYSCCNEFSQDLKATKHIVTPFAKECDETDVPFCTLIICPVSVMSNWVHQIESHVKPGVLRVQIYHGQDRHHIIDLIRSREVDIVITAYNVLASELPEDTSQSKSNGQSNNKKRKKTASYIFDINFHRIVKY